VLGSGSGVTSRGALAKKTHGERQHEILLECPFTSRKRHRRVARKPHRREVEAVEEVLYLRSEAKVTSRANIEANAEYAPE
jgi:hypothetical protein